jgi:hypothetical protein
MRIPTEEDAQALLGWRPPGGVISVYLDFHPEDRGEPWRIELRNGLAAVRDRADGEEAPVAATAQRIEERLAAESQSPRGRTRIGFVEVARKPGREEWFSVQIPMDGGEIALGERPRIGPLVAILDRSSPRGVVAVSAERVRLLLWSLAGLDELDSWGLEIFSLDWRERKAQRSADPARTQGAKASGRDQFEQRLEANRERFLRETGRLAGAALAERGCAELLAFGDPEHVREVAAGAAGSMVEVQAVDEHNLVTERVTEIRERVEEHVRRLERERELELVERVTAAARSGDRGSLGADETARALEEGRVEHLLLARDGGAAERMIEAALETSARVTQLVDEDAATALSEADGVGALLRY